MLEEIGCNSLLCLKEPLYENEKDGIIEEGVGKTASGKFWLSGLALSLSVKNGDIEMLNYLWNELYYLWDINDFDQLIDTMYNYEFLDALSLVLKGRAFKSILLTLDF